MKKCVLAATIVPVVRMKKVTPEKKALPKDTHFQMFNSGCGGAILYKLPRSLDFLFLLME